MKFRLEVVLLAGVLTAGAFSQSSAAAFDAPIIIGGPYTRLTNTLDFDGDGWKDAIGTWYPSSTSASIAVQGWRNDQTGKLAEVWAVTLSLGFYTLTHVDLATGDMNQDGSDDFVVAIGGTLYFFLSNGAAPPTLWTSILANGLVHAMQMSDFDGDGITDVAYVTSSGIKVSIVQPSGPPFSQARAD